MKIISLFCLLAASTIVSSLTLADDAAPAAAVPPVAVVVKIRGDVLFNDGLLKEGDVISKPGKIDTKEKSFIQLKIEKWNNTISIGPLSHMVLNFAEDKKYTLDSGICRWKSYAQGPVKGKIHTRNVAMGVRGTDFYLKANRILGETEVIMFDGEVLMENATDKNDSLAVKKGQWGGLGGRFGEKIRGPIDLPKEVLDTTLNILE